MKIYSWVHLIKILLIKIEQKLRLFISLKIITMIRSWRTEPLYDIIFRESLLARSSKVLTTGSYLGTESEDTKVPFKVYIKTTAAKAQTALTIRWLNCHRPHPVPWFEINWKKVFSLDTLDLIDRRFDRIAGQTLAKKNHEWKYQVILKNLQFRSVLGLIISMSPRIDNNENTSGRGNRKKR